MALGLRSAQVKAALVIEPPLVMSKVWPMRDFLRQKLMAAPAGDPLRDFIVNVFGVTEAGEVERDYRSLLDSVHIPVRVLVGDEPLFPQRAFEKLPSLVDVSERELIAAHPRMRLEVAPGAGHNVPQQAPGLMLQGLREMLAAV